MTQINVLRETLKPHLKWHGARLNFLALFLIALIRVKTVNLTELACGFRHNAQTDSNYKRLQRFFQKFDLDHIPISCQKYHLVSLGIIPDNEIATIAR